MCQFNLKVGNSELLGKKPTRQLTNSPEIAAQLDSTDVATLSTITTTCSAARLVKQLTTRTSTARPPAKVCAVSFDPTANSTRTSRTSSTLSTSWRPSFTRSWSRSRRTRRFRRRKDTTTWKSPRTTASTSPKKNPTASRRLPCYESTITSATPRSASSCELYAWVDADKAFASGWRETPGAPSARPLDGPASSARPRSRARTRSTAWLARTPSRSRAGTATPWSRGSTRCVGASIRSA